MDLIKVFICGNELRQLNTFGNIRKQYVKSFIYTLEKTEGAIKRKPNDNQEWTYHISVILKTYRYDYCCIEND